MDKSLMLVGSLLELLHHKKVKRILRVQLTKRERICFTENLKTLDRLVHTDSKDSKIFNQFAQLYNSMKCSACDSNGNCTRTLLALTEFKATIEGVIDQATKLIEDSIEKLLT